MVESVGLHDLCKAVAVEEARKLGCFRETTVFLDALNELFCPLVFHLPAAKVTLHC